MTDYRSREKSLPELEYNDLNIHPYLRLNYGTASEHLKYNALKRYGALWCYIYLSASSLFIFKSRLKTHFYSLAFPGY